MIIYRIILLILLITVIYSTLIYVLYNESEEKEEKETPKEERQDCYLQLQNMTSQEILLFKDKKEFIDSIKQYDNIKYFLKGTDEENIKQLIEWYYPGYEKL